MAATVGRGPDPQGVVRAGVAISGDIGLDLVESGVLDELDRGLVHALQLDGRAPFARIAEVLDVSEHTIARRYRRLRSAGVLRVVGAVDGYRLGYASWTVRLRCTPDAAGAIAAALARRQDTFWVHVLSGGTEISCNLQAGSDAERDGFLLEKLPGTRRVLGMSAHSMLQGFAGPSGWAGLAALTDEQAAMLRPDPPEADVNLRLDPPGADDERPAVRRPDPLEADDELAAAPGLGSLEAGDERVAVRRLDPLGAEDGLAAVRRPGPLEADDGLAAAPPLDSPVAGDDRAAALRLDPRGAGVGRVAVPRLDPLEAEDEQVAVRRFDPRRAGVGRAATSRLDLPGADDELVELAAGDRELLTALAGDGRLGHAELASVSGLSESTVRRRIGQLRERGVLSYQVEISPAELGYRAEARLWISVRPSAVIAVAQALANHLEVSFCAVTTGPSNIVAAVICRDSRHLYRYLTERVGALPDIDRVEAAPLIRTVKRNGAVLPV